MSERDCNGRKWLSGYGDIELDKPNVSEEDIFFPVELC